MATKSPAKKKKSKASPRSGRGPGLDARMLAALVAQLAEGSDSSPLERAQDVAWEAWDTPDRSKRTALAKKALGISPLCADAYVLLAQETPRNSPKALALYRQGVEAGEKALGGAAFREDVGHFWGILETRPYMRARHGLAMALWNTGAHDEAIAHYRDMLRLNPNDNQGIRYLLLDSLLILGRDEDAAKLLKRYKNDDSAAWVWSGALARFRSEGDTANARKALARAGEGNPHVATYLLGRKKLPRRLPALIGWGTKDEAIAYVADNGAAAWAAAPGALAWIETCPPPADKRRRSTT